MRYPMDPMTKEMYMEREFHRVVRKRDALRVWAWFWFLMALAGWGALIAIAFKAGILHL